MQQGSHRRFTGRGERRDKEGSKEKEREVEREREKEKRKRMGGKAHLLKRSIANVHRVLLVVAVQVGS